MISEIYRKYFQKSYTFLYPLLGFHKTKHPKPEQTYVAMDGMFSSGDRRLICEYRREDTDAWKKFEREQLITNKYFDQCIPMDDDTIVYVFDLNILQADFDAFLSGKYSTMSVQAKKVLTDYYGVHTPEWVYIESFLFPEKYFKQYAAILRIDEEILREVGELCENIDQEKETFTQNSSEQV